MLTDASKTKTAFKHPNCGGIVLQCEKDGAVYFECDECAETAEDIGPLVLRSLVIIRKRSSGKLEAGQ